MIPAKGEQILESQGEPVIFKEPLLIFFHIREKSRE